MAERITMKIQETLLQVHIISSSRNDNRDFLKDVQRIIYNLIQKLRAKRPDIAQNIKREIRENRDLKAFNQTECWIEREIVSSDSPSNRVLNKLFKTLPYMQLTTARYIYLALSKDVEQDNMYSKLSAKAIKSILAEQSDSLYKEWTGAFPVKKTAAGKKILRTNPKMVEKVFGDKKVDVKLFMNTVDFIESFLANLEKDPNLLNKIHIADAAFHTCFKNSKIITEAEVSSGLKIKLRKKLAKFNGPEWNFLRSVFSENSKKEELLVRGIYRQILINGVEKSRGWSLPEYYKTPFIVDFATDLHFEMIEKKPAFYTRQVKKYKIRQSKSRLRVEGARVRGKTNVPAGKTQAPRAKAAGAQAEPPKVNGKEIKVKDFRIKWK